MNGSRTGNIFTQLEALGNQDKLYEFVSNICNILVVIK